VIDTNPHVGGSLFTKNNATFLPQPRIAVAWSPLGRKTVFRAGFGMYNDLQDALVIERIKMLRSILCTRFRILRFRISRLIQRRRYLRRPSLFGRRAAGHENADADFVVAAGRAGIVAQNFADGGLYRFTRLPRVDWN